MRPVTLTIQGFACYRDEQVVDFEGLGLFAIAGPTGAGKSTILDGMVFALYGRVPRVGKVGATEFISLGNDRMSAILEFVDSGRRYRVARVARRRGANSAQLDADDGTSVGGVRDVDVEVERLLGLGADAFLQSVVLPQGKFADFLKSKPADR